MPKYKIDCIQYNKSKDIWYKVLWNLNLIKGFRFYARRQCVSMFQIYESVLVKWPFVAFQTYFLYLRYIFNNLVTSFCGNHDAA